MSGFAGIIRLEPSLQTAEADRAAIARMAEAIAFRGPDAQQQWTQHGASFAFSLLTAGPAPQAASQPVTLDGNTWLLGDARLDRRRELLQRLAAAGKPCDAHTTDEEIVLLAWKLWLEDGDAQLFCQELHGDCGFAIWERDKRELHCFRDVMGCRPFYYCCQGGTFSFSNTLNALQSAPGFTRELDHEYIGDFLLAGWCPRPEHTIYRVARRLPAGCWLTFSDRGVSLRRLRQLPVEEPLFLKREEEYVEAYRDLLGKAVADRLPHGPAAIFLSGGMDSSSIAATVCALRKTVDAPNALHAVTGDLRPLFEDQEGNCARQVAEHLNIGFELSHYGGVTPFSGLEGLGRLFPEPIANPFRSIYLHLYRQSSAKARVVFLGYGGDDVLTGQAGPYLKYLFKTRKASRAITEFAAYTMSRGHLPPLRLRLGVRMRRLLHLTDNKPQFPAWLNPDFERAPQLRDRWRQLRTDAPVAHPIHIIGYRSLTGTYWPQSMDNEDSAFIGLPLEHRTPLFDYRLLRFLLRLPALPWCIDKEIVRRAMKDALPASVLWRAKSPLPRDPVLLHRQAGNWNPQEWESPTPEILEFVNWPLLLESRQQRAADLWCQVNPAALNLWLKSH